jgi:TnpA family transposase
MYLRVREFLTKEQRQEITHIPLNLSEQELITNFTLNIDDINFINKHRRDHNRLGIAVQLSILRYNGWSMKDKDDIPVNVLKYIARQLSVSYKEFNHYFIREATRFEHLEEIRQEYLYKNFTNIEIQNILKYTTQQAMENGDALHLVRLTIEQLRKLNVILPAIATIERTVWEARKANEDSIYTIVNNSLTLEQKRKLDKLLEASADKYKTTLAWLKEVPSNHSPKSFLDVIKRLECIKELNLHVDIKGIHQNRIIQLSRLGSRYEPHSFRRFDDLRRYSLLAIYLIELSQSLIDQAIEIHDRHINSIMGKGRKEQEKIQKHNGKSLNEKIIHYANLGAALIKAKNEGLDPFDVIENIMSWNKLVESVGEAKSLARPMDYDYLDLIDSRYNHLRKYTPTLIKCIEFRSTKSSNSLIEALEIIKSMNKSGKRKVPDNAPLDFINSRWSKYVFLEDGTINRHYYELAALTELKNSIRSGDISVVGSRHHKDFKEYLVSEGEWSVVSKSGIRLAVGLSYNEYIKERQESLRKRIEWLSNNIDSLDCINLEHEKIQLKRLEKNTPDEARGYSSKLYSLIPKIKLTDLLIEVAKWTKFDEELIHLSTGHRPNNSEKEIVMATLVAMGTNIGLSKMADATQNISYHQMSNVTQWRMYDDALNKAQAVLVNFQHKLSLPLCWGNGSTSSSDGMRVQIGVSALNAEHNPHYGSGKGTTIYRFVSDQFSSFYTKVINTSARDAVHVIDGLLHHETDLDIIEHYTDTAGFTEQTFGLCHLLGFRFAPRLRDVANVKLYYFNKSIGYSNIDNILKSKINTTIIKNNYEDVLKLAYSIQEGKVSASLIMGKLGSYARQNSIATALKEMGRIEKTIFILDYISNEELRRRIQRGLNKGEAMNALARAIFFGKRGEFYERDLQDQLQRASALNIIINAISIWNTIYLEKAVKHLKNIDEYRDDLMKHISPLSWDHINFYGQYNFNMSNVPTLETLRPLNII